MGRGGGVVNSDVEPLRVGRWMRSGRFLANRTKKGVGVVILFSRITEFEYALVTGRRWSHYVRMCAKLGAASRWMSFFRFLWHFDPVCERLLCAVAAL